MKAIIHTPTSNLQESLDFYQSLNYKVLSEANPTLLTDGKTIIEVNPDRFARAGVKLFKASWSEEVKLLEKHTTLHPLEGGYLLNDLNGCWIYLVEGDLPVEHTPADTSFALTGNFMGVSLEAANMQRSMDIWEVLGFTITMGQVESGFVLLQHANGFGVSMMKPMTCPHLFFNPSMTFFNGKDNPVIIEKIRKSGIPITEEITHFNDKGIVDNIIIRDPGGYGFFIFND